MNLVMILCGLGIILINLYIHIDMNVVTDKCQERFMKITIFMILIVLWGAIATFKQHENPKIDEPLTVIEAVTPDGANTVTYALDNDGTMHQYGKELNEGYTLVKRYVPGEWHCLVYCVEGKDDLVPVKKENRE